MSLVSILLTSGGPYLPTYFSSPQSQPRGSTLVTSAMDLAMKELEYAKTTPDWSLDRSRLVYHPSLPEPDMPLSMQHICSIARVAVHMLLGCPLELRQELCKNRIATSLRSACSEIMLWVQPYPTARTQINDLVLVLDGDYKKVTALMYCLDSVRGLQGCGYRGCSKTIETSQLFQCSRCKTVLYCSKAHQKEDWSDKERPHKGWCYRTPW
ncbi:hypothetical protein CALVIDRAFT_224204 [Calocera viscosa TUFC12733]|uniref:MYND-type domain-containing protein n=1 Tax=Calocera viscosa (strain TUFC12733) TaxID=1330018 RepID=A0A167K8N4_CALVF|nr:hypothetical protein CALVIDRAFT_224204 [Calocera viscosa TUFC12733]